MKWKIILVSFGFALFSFGFSISVNAQGTTCNVTDPCQTDADCQTGFTFTAAGGCPLCIGCVNGFCAPKDTLCDDGNDCTTDVCVYDDSIQVIPPDPNGCQYFTIAVDFPPPDDLPIQCYICEPTANGVLVDNGICDRTAGEDCSNSPDCQEEGVPCGPPPLPPSFSCFTSPNQPGPLCQDGDRCTDDVCTPTIPPASVSPAGLPATCSNPEKICNPDSDGCCPAGCDGPDPATATNICRLVTGAPIPNCDADCWFPQVCGDALVQPPETCDDAANMGDAGISPTGAIVTDTQCRNVGEPAECTYCGDGIIQAAAGEECELGLIGSCGSSAGAGTCDLTTCQCVENLCVTGSGNIWNDIRPGCANCSFHSEATSQGLFQDYQPLFVFVGIAGLVLVIRRRSTRQR